jgi:hypothetical protein
MNLEGAAAAARRPEPEEDRPARCPACGAGDLFVALIGRRGAGSVRAGYCAGAYDAERRRVRRRSCGWAGTLPAPAG